MSFDKELYWKRRNNSFEVKVKETGEIETIKAPMRGQVTTPLEPKLVKQSGIKIIKILGKELPMNRKTRRKRAIDRLYCKKGYRKGVKIKK